MEKKATEEQKGKNKEVVGSDIATQDAELDGATQAERQGQGSNVSSTLAATPTSVQREPRRSSRISAKAKVKAQARPSDVASSGDQKRSRVVVETTPKAKQDIRKPIFNEVRKCTVRIQFDWQLLRKDYEHMVTAGIIFSIEGDGSAMIVADPTFFKMGCKFVVSFPKEAGYEQEQELNGSVVYTDNFCTFRLKPREVGYIKSAKFEIGDLKQSQCVDAFVFPRESYITPAGYCAGSIVDQSHGMIDEVCLTFHDCPLHEYAYLGSPLFNRKGHFVAMTYADQSRLHAWTVKKLKAEVLNNGNSISYVFNGDPIVEAPII